MRVRVGTRSDLACVIAEEDREPFIYCWTQLHSADGSHSGEHVASGTQQRHSKQPPVLKAHTSSPQAQPCSHLVTHGQT